MKRLVWLVLLLLICTCACAELNASLEAGTGSQYTLSVSFLNDTGSDIRGLRIYADGNPVTETNALIKSGETYTSKAEITKSGNDTVKIRAEYSAVSEEIAVPFRYEGVKLFIRLPSRALENGETVMAGYVLVNEGKSDLNGAVIRAQGFESEPVNVKAGGYAEIYAPVKVSFPINLSAEACIGKTVIVKSEKVTAEQLSESLTVTCVTTGQNAAGERIPVTINIDNRGNTAYTSPAVMINGKTQVSGLPAVIKAHGFVTVNTELPAMNESGDVMLTFTGRTENGSASTFVSDSYRIEITGTAPEIQQRCLNGESIGETSFVAEALLGISTLRGLSKVAVYTCAGLSAAFLSVIIARGARRNNKKGDKKRKSSK